MRASSSFFNGLSRTIRAAYLRFLTCLLGCVALFCAGSHANAVDVLQSQREVTFAGANEVKLAGTLLIPAHKFGAKVPGVIIVAGSGPTDRDGNSALLGVKINLLKQIAEQLAEAGIASLRYDKRGQYRSGKPPKDQESLFAFTRWENYVGDAAATLTYLQEQVEIDAGRTAMIGHSEGGMLILQGAVEGKFFRKPPAVLVLASTPGRRTDVILREQLARDIILRFFLKENDEILAVIRKTGQLPENVSPVLAGLYPPEFARFLQSELDFDAPAWASRFSGPVLVLSGEKDLQHVVAKETAALSAGLKKRQPDDHEVYIAPGASHNLKPVKSDNDHGFGGDLAPEAAAKLRSWLAKKLGSAATK